MNKIDIISKMKSLNLPVGSYVVFGSGPMAALEIREVNDIDLLITREVYEKLERSGWKKIHKGPGDEPLTYDVFEAHDNWDFSVYKPTLEDLLKNAFKVEGVAFASLKDVKKWKSGLRGLKHSQDLELINNYLKKASKL